MTAVSGRVSVLVPLSFGLDLGRSLENCGSVSVPGMGKGREQDEVENTRWDKAPPGITEQGDHATGTVVFDATFAEGTADIRDDME